MLIYPLHIWNHNLKRTLNWILYHFQFNNCYTSDITVYKLQTNVV